MIIYELFGGLVFLLLLILGLRWLAEHVQIKKPPAPPEDQP